MVSAQCDIDRCALLVGGVANDEFPCRAPDTPGLAREQPKKTAPAPPGRVHLTSRQTAAIAAFSVALGRIAADAFAGSGR